ncbi:rhodanese-like domain-containing protein, partial [Kingella kingae]|nr:rhodanese-like domain-containing protein [Kingella kingae]
AEVALQELRKMGYTNVTNYGGYQDLLAKGIR